MSRLIESIKLDNGRFLRLHYHQSRMDRTIAELLQLKNAINLSTELAKQTHPKSGLFKCRIVYEKQIESIEFLPYEPRKTESLKVVYDHAIEYRYKYESRSGIDLLFGQRQFCDDVLIVKNGFVTDSSISNIIFFDGYKWITPNTPLLKGTMRQFLIDAAEIKEQPVYVQDIPSFKSFRLINSMLGFDGPEIEVSKIVL
ncbi:MAG TPA: aminotransferase class IV [Cyclobacteriaceae bacterium]|nr:aminotransferase class IV [Cyclobacteriaceae bacterium]